MKCSGAQIVLNCLKEQKVDVIFGYPGGAVLPIYDAIYDSDIKHILTAHEQGASHAADGYARATGKVGVVLVTSGPGATNTVTGIATAYMDSVPLVVFTGQVACGLLGKDSFQEVDITGITHPITKHNYIVKDVTKLADIIREAFAIARSGRPGPVLIDIPKDVQKAITEYQTKEIDINFKKYIGKKRGYYNKEEIQENKDKAVDLIIKCKKPVIYAGGGVRISSAEDELLAFAEKIQAPVCCSLMGLGSFPGSHPLFMGLVGMHGTKYSNYAVSDCDVLIAVGARFSDRVISKVESFAPKAKIIHIDIDAAELGKNVDTNIPIHGDLKDVMKYLTDRIDKRQQNEWNEKVNNWRKECPLKYQKNEFVNPQFFMQELDKITDGKAVITTEVGQSQIWAAQYYKYNEPRTYISSGGLGTMGFGLGASIGAKVGKPDKVVVNIAGDGSFRMNANELVTISHYKLPIIQVVFNNSALGMVRQWQDLFYNKRFSFTTLYNDVDIIKLADAYGIDSVRVKNNDEVDEAIKDAIGSGKPYIIECIVSPDEKVMPMVPPGASISDVMD